MKEFDSMLLGLMIVLRKNGEYVVNDIQQFHLFSLN